MDGTLASAELRAPLCILIGSRDRLAIAQAELDAIEARYKSAVEDWIRAIHETEALATPAEHNEAGIDKWEATADNATTGSNQIDFASP